MKFSEKIVYMRKKRKISQDRLAKKMGVSRQTIYKWEADLNTPEFNKIERLADILDISYNLLLDDSIDLKEYFNDNQEPNDTLDNDNLDIDNEQNETEKSMSKKSIIIISIAICVALALAILIGTLFINDNSTDTDTILNTNTDNIVDFDTNTDTDTEADTNTDTNTDINVDTNTDTNGDTSSDTDTDTDTDIDIPVINHSWSEWAEIDKGTCNTPQILERECSECGEKETKEGEIVIEHKLSSFWHTKTPATCTETEVLYKKCSVCNTEKYKDGVVALGHAYDNEICVRCDKEHYTDGVIYDIYNGKAYVSGYNGTNTVVSISPYYTPKGETTKYPVTEVRRINSDAVTELIIPEGVEKIGDINFNCFNLKVVRFPSTLLQIFSGTFTSCRYLERIYINDLKSWCNVETPYALPEGEMFFGVPYDMYLNDELLTDLHITKDITMIKPYVFAGCKSIKNLTMEYNGYSSEISAHAFEESGLEYAQIDCSWIDKHAFSYCTNLKSVKLSNSTYFPYNNTFTLCYHLIEVYAENKGITAGDGYGTGGVGKYARIVHKSLDEPSIITETNDGFVFAKIDSVNYLIQYVGSNPVVKLPRSFNGEEYKIATYFHEGGSPNTTIEEIYIPKEVKYIEANALSAVKKIMIYFEVPSSLTTWVQRLSPSQYVIYGWELDY